MESSITHVVSLVIVLRDTLNDRLIGYSDFIFYIDLEKAFPIKKEIGYYVFVNLEKKQFELKISHRYYHTKILHIELSKLTDLKFILEIPLIPNYLHELANECLNLYGEIDPESEIYVIKNTNRSALKFINYKKQEYILEVINTNMLNILGATLAIKNSNKLEFETFYTLKKYSYEKYKINASLTETYKENDIILKAYMGLADKNGHFHLLINNLDNNFEYIVCFIDNGQKKFKQINFKQDNLQLIK